MTETKKEVVKIRLLNPYFEEEIEVSESYDDIKNQLKYYGLGNLNFITVTKRNYNKRIVDNTILINPKNFSSVEISKHIIEGDIKL